MPKKYALLPIFLFFAFSLCGQATSLDSLITVSKQQKGEALVLTLNEISWQYRNIQVDSALWYAKKAFKVAELLGDEKLNAAAFNSMASAFQANAVYDSAMYYHKKSLKINKGIGDSIAIGNTLNNLGIINDELGNFEASLENYFKALRIYENNGNDQKLVPMVLSNIGIVYKKQEDYDKVLHYYQQALAIYKNSNNVFGITVTTGNIGSVYLRLKKFQEAITYAENAAQGYQELGYTRYVPYMLNNIAVAQDSLGHFEKAEKSYEKAIELFINDGNDYELANTRIGYAKNQSNFKRYTKAISELQLALITIQEKDFKEFEINALKLLSEIYFKEGNFEIAYTTQQEYIEKKEALFQIEKTKSILELESKYQSAKKEKELSVQKAKLAENQLELNKKNYIIYSVLGLAFLLGLIGYLLNGRQKLKNKQLVKEGELKTALVQIETQNRLQEQRLRISRDLHDNIGSQLTFIISTIDTLRYGLKSGESVIKDKLGDLGVFTKTTINELRDTIWAMNKESITFEDLQNRINNFIMTANKVSEKIKFDFDVDSEIESNYTFTAIEGINLYRVIQESVNNALKYAFINSHNKTDKIEVSINKSIDYFHVEITDNGGGFNPAKMAIGNGMANIKKRVEDMNGVLNLKSQIGHGTSVEFKIPVNQDYEN